jgi:galactokinase
MPVYVTPYSDNLRLTFLKKTQETMAQDGAAGHALISKALSDSINTFIADYEVKVTAVSTTLGGRIKETTEAAEAVNTLSIYLRDLWEVLRRRTARLNHSVEVLAYYQLPQDEKNPIITVREEWLTIADKVIEGEKTAVAKGFPPMANPSVAELKTVLDSARKELAEISGVDRTYDLAQQAVAVLRPRADELITDVMEELRFTLRKQSASNQRRVMRSYGATYRFLPSEAEEAEEIIPSQPPQNQ